VRNPDHDAVKSFAPTDIPEGTQVQIAEEPNVQYEWRGGAPVKEMKNHGSR